MDKRSVQEYQALHPEEWAKKAGRLKLMRPQPLKILSSDILIADVNINPEKDESGKEFLKPEIEALITKYNLDPNSNSKVSLKTPQEFEDFKKACDFSSGKHSILPGGSCSNTLVQMSHVLGTAIQSKFIGVAGVADEANSKNRDKLIRDSLMDARVELEEQKSSKISSESALSFVINLPNKGGRVVATWPGTAKAIIKEQLTEGDLQSKIDKHVQETDVVFVGAGLASKFGDTVPVDHGHAKRGDLGFMDYMLEMRKEHGKDLWLAMPTQADFSTDIEVDGKIQKRPHEEKAKHTRWLVNQANVVLSNGEELSRVYTTKEERESIQGVVSAIKTTLEAEGLKDVELAVALKDELKKLQKTLEESKVKLPFDFVNQSINENLALERLQKVFAKEHLKNDTSWKGANKEQIGFITLGMKGIAVVQKDGEIKTYPALADPKTENGILHKIGCGDAAYAGVLSALASRKVAPDAGITYETAARAGNELANIKLTCEGARADKGSISRADGALGSVRNSCIQSSMSIF